MTDNTTECPYCHGHDCPECDVPTQNPMTTLNTIIEEEKKEFDEEIERIEEIYSDADGYEKAKLYLKSDKNTLFASTIYPETFYELDSEKVKDFLTTAMQRAYEAGAEERDTYWKDRDKHLDPTDPSTTRIAISTTCCGGEHQTIAGALLKSKEWKEWYDHASKNMLYDVDETLTIDAMSDGHFASFMDFVREKQDSYWKERVRKEVEGILSRHIKWKPTEGYGTDEELGFQKGLIAEAKLLEKELLQVLDNLK